MMNFAVVLLFTASCFAWSSAIYSSNRDGTGKTIKEVLVNKRTHLTPRLTRRFSDEIEFKPKGSSHSGDVEER